MSKRRAHKVKVRRPPSGADESGKIRRGIVNVYGYDSPDGLPPAVKGLMEPRKSQETYSGPTPVSQASHIFTWWGGETIKPGDEVTWDETGQVFHAGLLIQDVRRPGSRVSRYQAIELNERVGAVAQS